MSVHVERSSCHCEPWFPFTCDLYQTGSVLTRKVSGAEPVAVDYKNSRHSVETAGAPSVTEWQGEPHMLSCCHTTCVLSQSKTSTVPVTASTHRRVTHSNWWPTAVNVDVNSLCIGNV